MDKFSPKIPIQIGLTAYVAVVALGLMSYFFYKAMLMSTFFSGVVGVFYICLVLMLAIWSGIAYRGAHYNIISFSHAFLAVYIVFAFCCLGNTFSQLLVSKLIDKGFPKKVYEITIERTKLELDKKNIIGDDQKAELDKITVADFDPSYGDIAKNLGVMLAATAVFSLLVAMFIKRSSEDLIKMNQKNTISG